MNVSFGTLARVYSLWIFLGDNRKELYQKEPATDEPAPLHLAKEREARWTEKGEIVFHPVDPPDWR